MNMNMSQNSGMDSAKIVIGSKAYTINKYKDLKHNVLQYNAKIYINK